MSDGRNVLFVSVVMPIASNSWAASGEFRYSMISDFSISAGADGGAEQPVGRIDDTSRLFSRCVESAQYMAIRIANPYIRQSIAI